MADPATLTVVFASIQIEGVHRWKDAPSEVSFLRNLHRHVFHIKAAKQVNHDDRDVEFIMLGHQVRNAVENTWPLYTQDGTYNFDMTSCEVIAKELMFQLNLHSCEVSEDGENGAIVTRQPV